MGFYLRKSVSVGPLRFNLSKSGVGVSAGIKGLRFGAGPRGNYVHMGRHGLYYRATLPSETTPRSNSPSSPPPPSASDTDNLTPIESGSVAAMVDSSSSALLAELNEKQKRWRLAPWVVAVFVLVGVVLINAATATPNSNVTGVWPWVYVVAGIAATIAAHQYDTLRRSTVLFYDLEDASETRYQALHNAFNEVAKCGGLWHISARARVTDRKYNAGAAQNVQRASVRLQNQAPAIVKTNIAIPSLPAGNEILFFFPDRVLVFSRAGVGAVPYEALKLAVSPSRFIESSSVPNDAKVVGSTWKYVNKGGGPDKRFKNNRQLPIALYEELLFTSGTGLNELFQVSKVGVGQALGDALISMSALESTRQTPGSVESSSSPHPPPPDGVDAIASAQLDATYGAIPYSDELERLLLSTRPKYWEYLLFFGVMVRGKLRLDPKWRKHYSRQIESGPLLTDQEVMKRIGEALATCQSCLAEATNTFEPAEQARAFGPPGQPGDADRIQRLAAHLVSAYERLLDCAVTIRSTRCSDNIARLMDLLGRMVDEPLEQIRDYIDQAARELRDLPIRVAQAQGKPVALDLKLTLSIDEHLQSQIQGEIGRLNKSARALT